MPDSSGYHLIDSYMRRKLEQIRETYDQGSTKAVLANLRRGVGKRPDSQPRLWGMLLEGIPEELLGRGENISYSEWAVYISLTMYALHQQGLSISDQNMNTYDEKQNLGRSMAHLISSMDDEARIVRKFDILVTSSDFEELSYHLRTIIQLLRDKKVPLNYPLLAKDLFSFQFGEGAKNVGFKWGQSFYAELNMMHEKDKDKKTQDQS
ncbi:MAG: type I-E CRISPR-associated protein Cse2/CasB [Lachnospiraceae bacterium]|nr:type I-E CRISPR-associated protein Cse2/CasB [Lachnospiraceae bacterium]